MTFLTRFVVADNLSVSDGQAVLRSVTVWGSLRGVTHAYCFFPFVHNSLLDSTITKYLSFSTYET